MKKRFILIYSRERKDGTLAHWWYDRNTHRFASAPADPGPQVRAKDWSRFVREGGLESPKSRRIKAAMREGKVTFGIVNPQTGRYDKGTPVKRKIEFANREFEKREAPKRKTKLTKLVRRRIAQESRGDPAKKDRYYMSRIRWSVILVRWDCDERGSIIGDSPHIEPFTGALAVEGDHSLAEMLKFSSKQWDINMNLKESMRIARTYLRKREDGFTSFMVEENEGVYVNYFRNLTMRGNKVSGYNRRRRVFNPLKEG